MGHPTDNKIIQFAQLRVLLANRGNPDHSQDPDKPVWGLPEDEQVPVLDFEHASAVCQSYIAEHALGGGSWAGGEVKDMAGNIVARVTYNGRVFAPDRSVSTVLQEAADLRTYSAPTVHAEAAQEVKSAAPAAANEPAAVPIVFIRQDGVATGALAVLLVRTSAATVEEAVLALARAVSRWVTTSPAGSAVFSYAGTDLNIGDLDSHDAFQDESFKACLALEGIEKATCLSVSTESTVPFDRPLIDEEAMEGTPADEQRDNDGPHAWQTYHLHSNPDGSIVGRVSTNDNLDHGVPSEDATWDVRYDNRAAMEHGTGKSHVGISGVVVQVFLDGRKI